MLLRFWGNYFPIKQKDLDVDWLLIKQTIATLIAAKNYEQAILHLEKACHHAYAYNFIDDYWDKDIESFIHQLSSALLDKTFEKQIVTTETIFFFDYFILENRGFTQQYLEVLISEKKNIVFIIPDKQSISLRNRIIQTIDTYEKGEIISLDANSRCEKVVELMKLVIRYAPQKIFVHTAPWEIISCCVASKLNGTDIKVFLLNITDHAFWPGITCYENIIDFRSYGHNVNRLLKLKNEKNLLIIPTPAFIDSTKEFLGFPLLPEGSIIGFAGGSYYKIKDEECTFLNLIKLLLFRHSQFVFLFANVGGDEELKGFIEQNGLKERFILIGNRNDIAEVFKNSDIFFNTYPYGGGLMLHYALEFKKPIVSLWNRGLFHTRLDFAFDHEIPDQYLPKNEKEFIELAGKLIQDKSYRDSFTSFLNFGDKIRISFKNKLTQLINNIEFISKPILPLQIDQYYIKKFHFVSAYNYYSYVQFVTGLVKKRYLIPRALMRLNQKCNSLKRVFRLLQFF